MKQNNFLFVIALGIAVVFNSCNSIGDITPNESSTIVHADSNVYPSILTEPGITSNQIVVYLGDSNINETHLNSIIPGVKVDSCPCGDPNIKLLTLPDSLDVETAVATVRESDDSHVEADKNFEFGFPPLDNGGENDQGLSVKNIVDPLSLDLGYIEILDESPNSNNQEIPKTPVIAIVDTGIFPNAFRDDEITLFKPDELCEVETAGRNFVDNNDDLSDDIMHGTFVAKRIAKRIKELDSLEDTTTNYKILPLKVFSNGKGEYFDVVCAFSYIQQLIDNGVRIPIINASFGSSLGNLALTDLLVLKKYIDGLSQSSIIVASAGNKGEDNAQVPHFPSGYNNQARFIDPSNNIVAVAGYESNDAGPIQLVPTHPPISPEFGSNFGESTVDLAAPWAFRMTEVKEDSQTTIIISGLQGTSYSAAYVSGDLFHFLANQTNGLAPPNPIPSFLIEYYNNNRIDRASIQVIGGKYLK